MMTANVASSFIAFLYHGGEKNSDNKLNEPSQRAVVLALLYLHQSGLYLDQIRCERAMIAWDDMNLVTQTGRASLCTLPLVSSHPTRSKMLLTIIVGAIAQRTRCCSRPGDWAGRDEESRNTCQ